MILSGRQVQLGVVFLWVLDSIYGLCFLSPLRLSGDVSGKCADWLLSRNPSEQPGLDRAVLADKGLTTLFSHLIFRCSK